MLQLHSTYQKVTSSLSCFKAISKQDNVHPQIYLSSRSAYVFGDHLKLRVEFLERKFESVAKIPFEEDFESSENIYSKDVGSNITMTDELCRAYCDTLFYVNKSELINFLNGNYNSIAKLNKIRLTIETNDEITFKFAPIKKSVSVFPCEYKIDPTVQLCPNFRIEQGNISVSALLLYQALSNDLLSNIVKIEINIKKRFIRTSCIADNIKTKFVIKGEE